jgi:amidase
MKHLLVIAATLLAAEPALAATGPSEKAVKAALARIKRLDHGPRGLNAVIALNPEARKQARALDAQTPLGSLHGLPVLLKDNIDAEGLVTTAGSLALKDNVAAKDAPLTARIRAAGGVILGKANLSEWANFRSSHSLSGWSAVGGMTRNPHALDRSTCGSSAGSAAAVAAGYVPLAVGTETDGSITCPAAMNGVVGLKPTVGLVSRTGVVPISEAQDTAGPIARGVAEAALLLAAMAGSDPADPAAAEADARKTDYVSALKPGALQGARLGVLTYATGYSPAVDQAFARAVEVLKAQGAVIVPLVEFKPDPRLRDDETLILRTEFKAGVAAYLKTAPAAVKARSLADLIAFNDATPRETVLFGQETFLAAEALPGLDSPAYLAAKAEARRLAGPEGIDRLLATEKLDALIAPTTSPAWRLDSVVGDNFQRSASGLPAVAGYPHLTVPMGLAGGMPVGISFIAGAWSEAKLLALGFDYEQASKARVEPGFRRSLEEGLEAFDPAPPSP